MHIFGTSNHTSGNILIVGDFNFHVDNTRSSDTITFNKILESFNLQQHVNEPTHKQGHTLDLIITRNEDRLVNDIKIHDPVISSSPWYNEEIGKEKRKRRRLERRWRTSGLCIDRQLYVKQCM